MSNQDPTGSEESHPPSVSMRPFSASLPMALLATRETAMRFFRPLLAEYDLTEQQWRVLRALAAASPDRALDAGELAAATCLLPPSLSRIIDNLEKRGLIERNVDAADQRRALLTLSGPGFAKVNEIAPRSERRYARIESTFGSERLRHLIDELHAFTELVEADGASDRDKDDDEAA